MVAEIEARSEFATAASVCDNNRVAGFGPASGVGLHRAILGGGYRAMRAMFGGSDQEGDPSALPGPSPPALGEQRRGPGRPRKFQQPPE